MQLSEHMRIRTRLARLGVYSFPSLKSHDPASISPSPHKPLFLSFLDAESYRQRDLTASDPSFSKLPLNIQETFFRGLYKTDYITEIEVKTESVSSNLTIMIDGRVYGDYSHIRVAPVVNKDNKRLNFNLMTFVDIN